MSDKSDKAESLASKMTKLTEKFDLVEDLIVDGDDIVQHLEEKTHDVEVLKDTLTEAEIIDLQTMADDTKFVRETCEEIIKNGRKVLARITLDLLDEDDKKREGTIVAFAELSKAINDSSKMYMQVYKDAATVLLNLDKIQKNVENDTSKVVNNTVNVVEGINPTELIKQLKELKELKKGD